MNTPTPLPPQKPQTAFMQRMFGQIAERYDLLNRLISLGQDPRWRRLTVRRLRLREGERFLDLGGGTGALTAEALRATPRLQAITTDLTLQMLQVGKHHTPTLPTTWVAADALRLPFPSGTFDAAASAFLLRNVPDLDAALQEQYRILRPGGRWAALETCQPPRHLLAPLMHFHLRVVIPWLGKHIAHNANAYHYLRLSTQRFLTARALAERVKAAGFQNVQYQTLMFGAVAIYWAQRPPKT